MDSILSVGFSIGWEISGVFLCLKRLFGVGFAVKWLWLRRMGCWGWWSGVGYLGDLEGCVGAGGGAGGNDN